jgi:hypothetical protein
MTDTLIAPPTWRLPLTARIALVAAAAWSVLLLVAAFTFPAYGTSSSSASLDANGNLTNGAEITGTATLVGVNGLYAALLVCIPLAVTAAVALLLRIGVRPARVAAWVLVGLLGAFTVLGLMSIGLFILPVTVALVVACASASQHRALTVGE